MLVSNRDDMVVKQVLWALRDLVAGDRKAVMRFLDEHNDRLAAQGKREVRHNPGTRRKTPRRWESLW